MRHAAAAMRLLFPLRPEAIQNQKSVRGSGWGKKEEELRQFLCFFAAALSVVVARYYDGGFTVVARRQNSCRPEETRRICSKFTIFMPFREQGIVQSIRQISLGAPRGQGRHINVRKQAHKHRTPHHLPSFRFLAEEAPHPGRLYYYLRDPREKCLYIRSKRKKIRKQTNKMMGGPSVSIIQDVQCHADFTERRKRLCFPV